MPFGKHVKTQGGVDSFWWAHLLADTGEEPKGRTATVAAGKPCAQKRKRSCGIGATKKTARERDRGREKGACIETAFILGDLQKERAIEIFLGKV